MMTPASAIESAPLTKTEARGDGSDAGGAGFPVGLFNVFYLRRWLSFGTSVVAARLARSF